MNSVVLIGRLTRDPEVRYISESQMAIATFTVAIDRPTRSGQEKKTDLAVRLRTVRSSWRKADL